MKIHPLLGITCAASMISAVGSQAWAAEPVACARLADLHEQNLTITSATDVSADTNLGGGGAAGGPGAGGPGRGGPGAGGGPGGGGTGAAGGPGAGGGPRGGGPGSGPGAGGPGGGGGALKVSTPFCRVVGYLTPTSDSHIGFEVWLPPATTWNHRLEAVGNGGFSGNVNLRAMVPGLSRGYATMTTDEGHINKPEEPVEDVSWALGHPEKFIDYAYRAEHVTTIAAKQIIAAYYGTAATHSFYSGCSAGGIQGMVEMLRYPKDYDGYIIGDATPDHMSQELGAFWNTMAASIADPSEAFKPNQVALIHKEALKQCVGKDGGASGDTFLSDPLACSFDPKPLACSAGAPADSCLSPAQMTDLGKIFQGPVDERTHKQILAGLTAGTETSWARYFTDKKNPVGTERPWAGFMAYVAYGDPDYLTKEKYLTFNFGSDYETIAQRKLSGQTLDAVFNTWTRDMDPVKAEGGKVIQYHGWEDPNIPSLEAVNFFNEVVADQAKRHHLTPQQAQEETEKFYRLFMVPGMGHCAGGAGPNSFGQNAPAVKGNPEVDVLSALETWVDTGAAPEKFIGSRMDQKTRTVDMTRPVCPYPQTPVWNGSGNPDEASSFTCKVQPEVQRTQK